jgi:hypothetical protein
MAALGVVTALAAVLVVPSLVWLLVLTHKGSLSDATPPATTGGAMSG